MQTQKEGENPMKKHFLGYFFPIQFVDILRDLLTIFLLHGRRRAGWRSAGRCNPDNEDNQDGH